VIKKNNSRREDIQMKKKRLTLHKFGRMYIEIRRLSNPEYRMGQLDGRYIHKLWLALKKEYGKDSGIIFLP
jgi:hypothetical protein